MTQSSADATTSSGATTADPRRWAALAVIAAAQLLVVLDASVVNIALPSAQQALGMSDVAKQWVVTGYSLAFGGLLLLGGRMADLHGRKRMFIGGLVGFAVASAVGGLAENTATLLTARAAQGGFAAFLAPAGLALLATTFTDPAERGRAFGIFGAAVGTGGVVGMVLGGVLTDLGSWRWCLLINVPVVAIIVVAALKILGDSRISGPVRYDLPGTLTATFGVGALIYGISLAVESGWVSPWTISFIALGIVLLTAFVLIEKRSKAPMMPLRIVRDRVRGTGYAVVFLIGGALYAFYLFLTYYLQVVQDYSPLRPLKRCSRRPNVLSSTRCPPVTWWPTSGRVPGPPQCNWPNAPVASTPWTTTRRCSPWYVNAPNKRDWATGCTRCSTTSTTALFRCRNPSR
jgi:MFS family permease